jgi:outer membrane biosynthesis protein TonB
VSADLLDRATQALRSTTASTPAELERGLERLGRGAPRKRAFALAPSYLRTLAWTVAAMFLGVGAWASVSGRVNWFEAAPKPPPAPAAPAMPAAKTSVQHPPRASERVPPEPAPEPVLVEPAPPALPTPVRKPRATTPPPRAEPPAARPDADALYRTAHAAHFVRGDYAAALSAWDDYLAAAEPGHRWRLEASYNRGIALYRLGHTDEARRALEPFARGEYGSYRRAEAERLLQALPAD